MKYNSKISIKNWILIMFLCFPAFYGLLKQMIGSASVAHIFLILLTYVPFAYIFIVRHEPVYKVYLLFVMSIAVIFVFYGILNIQNDFLLESYALPTFLSFFSGGIAFFFMAIQNNYLVTKKALKKITVILFAYYVYYSLNIDSSSTYQWGYDMFLGYKMLLPCLLSLNFALTSAAGDRKMRFLERSLWFGIFGYATYVILTCGSRGPFIGIFCYLIMKYGTIFLPDKNISALKKFLISFLVILAIIVFLLEFDKILFGISYFFKSIDISSRTLDRLMMGTITDDNGRSDLYAEALGMVNVLGNGPFSDQFYFGEGNYCHNFIIEVLFDFGIFGGTFALIFIAWKAAFIIKNSAKTTWYEMFTVFFSFCVGRLSFSGTFWSETNFWLLLAIGVLCIREIRNDSLNVKDIYDG